MATTGEAFIQTVRAEITGLQNMITPQAGNIYELEQQVGQGQTNLVRMNGQLTAHENLHDPYMRKVDMLEQTMMNLTTKSGDHGAILSRLEQLFKTVDENIPLVFAQLNERAPDIE